MTSKSGGRYFHLFDKRFYVGPDVWFPYYSKEFLTLQTLSFLSECKSVCDMGTGTGYLSIVWMHRFKGIKQIVAVDQQEASIKSARRNATAYGLASKVECIQSNLFSKLQKYAKEPNRFDAIVFNGPHLDLRDKGLMTKWRRHDRNLYRTAIDPNLSCARRFFSKAGKYLREGGWLCYTFSDFASKDGLEDLFGIIADAGYSVCEIIVDDFGPHSKHGAHRLLPEALLRETIPPQKCWHWYTIIARRRSRVTAQSVAHAFERAISRTGESYFGGHFECDSGELTMKVRRLVSGCMRQLGPYLPRNSYCIGGFLHRGISNSRPDYILASAVGDGTASRDFNARLTEFYDLLRCAIGDDDDLVANIVRERGVDIPKRVVACVGERNVLFVNYASVQSKELRFEFKRNDVLRLRSQVKSALKAKTPTPALRAKVFSQTWKGLKRRRFPDVMQGGQRGSLVWRKDPVLCIAEKLLCNCLVHMVMGEAVLGAHISYLDVRHLHFAEADLAGCAYVFSSAAPTLEEEMVCWEVIHSVNGIGVQADELLQAYLHRHFSVMHSTRSALTAIMSRNMSHNIGSHVLSRIGSDASASGALGLLPDMKRNARYVQQRMDFIAQVCSDWPVWTQPAELLGDVLRGFLEQFLVLEFIAASEGLRAHRYRRPSDGIDATEGLGRIRLHLIRVPEWCWSKPVRAAEGSKLSVGEDAANVMLLNRCKCSNCHDGEACVNGTTGQGMMPVLATGPEYDIVANDKVQAWTGGTYLAPDQRFAVAVPGGSVGFHAFFVLLENVIRNGAKHGWAGRQKPAEGSPQPEVFDVVIEVCDDPEDSIGITLGEGTEARRVPAWLVRVYDNASRLGSNDELLWGNDAATHGLNDRLQKSVVNDVGELRRADWGLAEMRIAAGYLQQRPITAVGAGGESLTGPQWKRNKRELDPTMLEAGTKPGGSPHIIRAVRSPFDTLGYEFYLRKPRVVGIRTSKVEAP